MNPFLENLDVWHDFRARFIAALAEEISRQVGDEYIVKIGQRTYLHELPFSRVKSGPRIISEKESFITISTYDGRELTTVVELLSPAIKQVGSDRDQFNSERDDRLSSTNVNLIEIDLLRGGERTHRESLPTFDYAVMLSRREQREKVQLYVVTLRQRLPTIPVPLQTHGREPCIDLQAVIDRVYDAAGYHHYLYESTPEPPLSPSDAEWAEQVLRNAGFRRPPSLE